MLHNSICVPESGFSREAAVLLSPSGAQCCQGRAGAKCLSLCTGTRKWEKPSKNFSAAVVRQQTRLRSDRPLLKCVSTPRCASQQSNWNYIEWHEFTIICVVKLALFIAGFKEALTKSRSLQAMVSLHAHLAEQSDQQMLQMYFENSYVLSCNPSQLKYKFH